MAGFSTYLANAIINHVMGLGSLPTISNRYFALFTSDPTDSFVTNNEVSAGWYVRKPTGSWASPTTGTTYNMSRVEFPAVTGSGITITHVGICDALSGGNLLFSEAISGGGKTLAVNDVFVIDTGTLTGDYTLALL